MTFGQVGQPVGLHNHHGQPFVFAWSAPAAWMCIAGSDTGFARQVAEPCSAVSGTESRSPVFAPCTVVPDTRSPPLVGRWCTVLLARQSRSHIWSGLLSRPDNLFQSLPSKPCTFLPGSSFPQSVWQPCTHVAPSVFSRRAGNWSLLAAHILFRKTDGTSALFAVAAQFRTAIGMSVRSNSLPGQTRKGARRAMRRQKIQAVLRWIDSSWLCCEAELEEKEQWHEKPVIGAYLVLSSNAMSRLNHSSPIKAYARL